MTRECKKPHRKRHPPTTPQGTDEILRQIFTERMHRGMTYDDLSKRSGVAKRTILAWLYDGSATLPNVKAVAAVLGLELTLKAKLPKRHLTWR